MWGELDNDQPVLLLHINIGIIPGRILKEIKNISNILLFLHATQSFDSERHTTYIQEDEEINQCVVLRGGKTGQMIKKKREVKY